ncbi:MAG: hypothetical protein QW727_02495 [Candidatus Pacearchaeota archaeon]
MNKRGKKAAIEFSMTTIIIIVLSLVLLIMGFVFVRSIMCGAIGFTEEINSKVTKEIQQLFETSGGELVCIGSQEAKTMVPGQTNFIYCSINAKQQGNTYTIRLESITSNNIPQSQIQTWVTNNIWQESNFPTNDKVPRKTLEVRIPDDASEGDIRIKISATKTNSAGTNSVTGSKDLDFKVTRTGIMRNILC